MKTMAKVEGKVFSSWSSNGERIFTFIQISEEHIRLQHSKLFSGLGSFVAGARLFKDIENSLQQMNNAFKKRVKKQLKWRLMLLAHSDKNQRYEDEWTICWMPQLPLEPLKCYHTG